MKRNFDSEIDSLKKEVKDLTKQLRSVTKHSTNMMSNKAEGYWDDAKEYYDELSDKTKEEWAKLKDTAQEKGHDVDRYVHEKPWQMASMAAAVGFLAAMLIGRRGRR